LYLGRSRHEFGFYFLENGCKEVLARGPANGVVALTVLKYNLPVTLLDWLAAIVLFMQLPIPLFWFVLHPKVSYWRDHQNAAFVWGLSLSWPPVTTALILYHRELFDRESPPPWRIALGFALIILEGWIFWRVKKDLGTARLIGKTELSGAGEIAQNGIYGRIRHPRYLGSFLALLGACLLAGKPAMWIAAGVWCVLTLIAIAFEQRELRARFGDFYVDYCRRVPGFIPKI
jgi:protein-S-isoprenylcysteine O-methyltransferase Ste14